MDSLDLYKALVWYTVEEEGQVVDIMCKSRPVVIIGDSTYLVEVFEITSHEVRDWDSGDYKIIDWQEAGLNKPSVLRLSYTTKIVKTLIKNKIGRFTLRDIKGITDKLKEIDKR